MALKTKNTILGILLYSTSHASAAVIESGSFYSEVLELKNLAFTEDSGKYVAPTVQERADFRQLAINLYDHNWATAETQANNLGYDLVKFSNTTTNSVYWGVREQLVDGAQTKGWGSFFINENAVTNVTIEVPHPVFDGNTHRLGERVFERSEANGFMLAGSHRSANGSQTANPTSLEFSIFQEVHEIWNGGYGDSTAWQMHGYGATTKSYFPDGTDAVMSDGAGNVTPELIALDIALEALPDNVFGQAYVYNQLDTDNPLNELVNGVGQNGHDPFWRLRAFNNPQGQFSRDAGGTFVHIETSTHIRSGSTNRETYLANAIVSAINTTSQSSPGHVTNDIIQIPTVPEPGLFGLFFASVLSLFYLRRHRATL
tara:strand:+ start:14494 stop:15609 length:1116 start_codon:yes stop_codon:yes gene_type:complete